MRRIVSLIGFDLTNAVRDSMVVYILAAPLLLAGGLRLFLPSVEGSLVRFAVEVPTGVHAAARFADRLEEYGRVERYSDADELRARVLATDDVGGFARDGDGWRIVLEGNESPGSVALLQSVLLAASADEPVGEYTVVRAESRSPIREYASVGLVMLASLIGGLAVAFAMIDEKEQNVTRAFAVTPLTPLSYFAARGILASAIGFVVATVGHFILVGTAVPAGRFFAALLVSAPQPLVVALLVGGIARNQIQALATLKIVMVIYLTVPFASIAVPVTWHWLFYAFPNYWMFRTFEGLYVTGARAGDFPLAALVTLVLGFVTLFVLGVGLGRQLKPR